MNKVTASLSVTDQIFATLEVGGKIVASVSKSNFATINEIIRFVSAMAGRFMGLARLNIRNKSQGWSMHLSLASKQHAPQVTPHSQSHIAVAPVRPAQYRQASLFN